MASRGGRLRFAAVLGRDGRYQLQLLAGSPASYKLTVRDPSVPIAMGRGGRGTCPWAAPPSTASRPSPGQLLQAASPRSRSSPVLRLYDAHGSLVGRSSEDADALEGRVTHMVVKEGLIGCRFLPSATAAAATSACP